MEYEEIIEAMFVAEARPAGSPRPCWRRWRRGSPRAWSRTWRESADVDEAGLVDVVSKHVRAVFTTLAGAVDAEEWFDMIAELPGIQRAHPGTFGLRRGAPRSGQR
jgi:hypothetical protein